MINQSLFCKFKENNNVIFSGIIIKKTNILLKKKKLINLFLNFGIDQSLHNYSEKNLEKEINFLINNLIQKNQIFTTENFLFLDLYLIIIKNEGNLIMNCTNCVFLVLGNLGIKLNPFVFQKSLYSIKKFNQLFTNSISRNIKSISMWNIIIDQIISARLICRIQAFGLITRRFMVLVIVCFLNLKILIKLKLYLNLPIAKVTFNTV
nr:hypothetical protein Cry52Nrm1_p088 [Cryptomonas curvata]